MACRRQVDDRKPPVADADVPLNPVALTIRTTMGDGIGHLLENRRRDGRTVEVDKTGNAAHVTLLFHFSGGMARSTLAWRFVMHDDACFVRYGTIANESRSFVISTGWRAGFGERARAADETRQARALDH